MADAGKTVHIPVLLAGVLAQLGDLKNKKIVDGTFGGGGYSTAFLEAGAHVLAIDRDTVALERGKKIQEKYQGKLSLSHGSFADLNEILKKNGWDGADAIVLDLGISSDQLDTAERGFGYQNDGPLDMRMGNTGSTAANILATASEHELASIFKNYGDEPKAKPLAKKIVQQRKEQPVTTTREFLELIEQVYPPRQGLNRRHPAQRIFQALRIAVNDELKAVEEVVPQAIENLNVGGKFCVVTFHSLEDRFIKNAMRDICQSELDNVGRLVKQANFRQPVKKVVPTQEEVENNPRARSATLRVLERVSS
ncbi:MAG: 16S rRNA (cytosine(1402)-N(4))-methyltransferase RsmH [Alphaproteobacteria bacterium]|nr:16S rRNA (cytosine(1402)-N(4))-methyltransferase RsmH [Alphaproteobacteria bacterium]MDD9919631.1 16S rRNA (cytosine(1402)-N(4))-methyltransferase RsmH [Alphaproteobacteria bacterium]